MAFDVELSEQHTDLINTNHSKSGLIMDGFLFVGKKRKENKNLVYVRSWFFFFIDFSLTLIAFNTKCIM